MCFGAVDAISPTHPRLFPVAPDRAFQPVRAQLRLVFGRVINHFFFRMREPTVLSVVAGLPLEHVLASDRQVVKLAANELRNATNGFRIVRIEAQMPVVRAPA